MASANTPFEETVSPPTQGERLCFLVGAGISHDLTQVGGLIEALITELARPLGTDKQVRIARRMMRQSLPSGKVDSPVRLEYLLQLIKDYFQADFTFLERLYNIGHQPNTYHRTLAKAIEDSRHVVFTTNFDCQIESVESDRGFVRAVFRKAEFRRLSAVDEISGLFKLHGSTRDVRTLGATFDSTTEREHRDKRKVLETGLKQGALCVLGYGGGDDTDVVPTLLETRAQGNRVYWFSHKRRRVPTAYSLDDPGSIPDAIKKDHAYVLLDRMISSKVRDPNDVVLIVGDAGKAFRRFLTLRGMEIVEGPSPERPGREFTQRVIEDWFKEVAPAPEGPILSTMVGTVLAYVVGRGHIPQHFARTLGTLTEDRPEWRPLALPKISMATYDINRFTKAARLAQKALDLLNKPSATRCSIPRRLGHLEDEARLDAHVWLAEALRMKGETRSAVEVAQEGLRSALLPSSGSNRRRIQRLRGDLYATIGECQSALGHLSDAKQAYKQSMRDMQRAAEWNWYWYARLGVADILRAAGFLRMASEEYQRISEGSRATGWKTWLALQIRISEFDVLRIRSQPLNDAQSEELQWLADKRKNTYDDEIAFAAEVLKWQFSWMSDQISTDEIERDYMVLLGHAGGDEDTIASLRLDHSEFLKHANRLDLAQGEAEAVVEHADASGYKLLALHGRLLCEDIGRMRGGQAKWRPLAAEYRRLGCPIGELYACAVGVLGGAMLSGQTTSRLSDFCYANGICWATDILSRTQTASAQRREAQLLFPAAL